ncbi:MAG TPA: phosphatase PAP2 family protein [Candidatus Sulfotelmatobacter sp.]|nr:phosphatase PAP2 family protein [Candidatus Sulfotelmatobacter sp.]
MDQHSARLHLFNLHLFDLRLFNLRSRNLHSFSRHSFNLRNVFLTGAAAVAFSTGAFCQTIAFAPASLAPDNDLKGLFAARFDESTLRAGMFDDQADPRSTAVQTSSEHQGIVERSVKRTLEDQKGLYLAPLKVSNLKWDAIVLGGTAGLLIGDRSIENALPGGHYTFYQTSSDIAIAGLGATLASVWIYGIKGDHPHARELGDLELETLVNTFLIYAPMQYIAGRQRPGEGNGHGNFLEHHAMNTSFPGGHAMFAWAMATVAAREYPKPWVRVLAYTSALTVTAGRLLGRDHWSSDMFVGTALGLAIGTHIFHARCDPELSESCRHHTRGFKMMAIPGASGSPR